MIKLSCLSNLKTGRVYIYRLLVLMLVLVFSGSIQAYAITSGDLNSINGLTPFYDPNAGTGVCTAGGSTSSASTLTAGSSVYILGDSITVRSESQYSAALAAKNLVPFIDAKVGRSWASAGQSGGGTLSKNGTDLSGADALIKDTSSVAGAGGIVIALGSNGGLAGNPIDTIISAVRKINPTAPIWWVNLTGTSAWTSSNLKSYMGDFNKQLAASSTTSNFKIVNWAGAVAPAGDPFSTPGSAPAIADPNGLLADGLHPTTQGSSLLASLVTSNLSSAAATGSIGTSCCSTSPTLAGSDNQQKAFNYFVSKGLTPQQSAGLIGNLMAESGTGLNPKAQQNGSNTPYPIDKVGFGIAQWTFAGTIQNPGRQTKLVQFAAAANLPVTDLGVQLDFVWQELSTGFGHLLTDLKSTVTVHDAVLLVLQKYEAPADKSAGGPNDLKRTKYANEVLALYGAGASATGATVSSGCATPSVGIGAGSLTPSSLPAFPGSDQMILRAQALAASSIGSPTYEQYCTTSKSTSCEGMCDHLAGAIWLKHSSGYCSAIVHWQSLLHGDAKDVHLATAPDGLSPPVGALLFYTSGQVGHVTVYLGNNMVLSGDVLGKGGVFITSFKSITAGAWHLPYLGWTPPIFGDTGPPAYKQPIPCPK